MDKKDFKLSRLPENFKRLVQEYLTESLNTILPFSISFDFDVLLPRDRYFGIELDRAVAYALDFDHAVTRALDLDLDLARTYNRNHDFELDIELARDRIYNIAYAIAHDSRYLRGEIADSIKNNDMLEAKRLSYQLQKSSDIHAIRLGNLLVDLLTAATARTATEVSKAQWRYVSRIAEYSYVGFGKMKYAEGRQQAMLDFYWWLQILMARADGKLPAWEGIRIVRERP
jgi:hypothetical protein